MSAPKFQTITQQVAAHLRDELLRGRWSESLPGARQLAPELGVNAKTVIEALHLLEKQGLLESQGVGRARKIVESRDGARMPMLKVALLPFDEFDLSTKCTIELRHQIEREGHSFFVLDKTLLDLDMDVGRVARTVGRTKADAWVLIGATQEVLEWFVEKEVPAFSLFGVHTAVPIAAGRPDKQAAFADFTRRLIRLGHTRISFVCRRHARKPQPSKNLCGYLGELEAAGIAAGDFNLPDWEESREGFAQVLDSLFRITPPTALIIEESYQYQAAYHQLSRMGFRVPEDVSLICTDSSPEFVWCKPSVSYVHWDYNPLVRRMVRWTNNVAKGRNDRRQFTTEARFFEGGSIGPALKDR